MSGTLSPMPCPRLPPWLPSGNAIPLTRAWSASADGWGWTGLGSESVVRRLRNWGKPSFLGPSLRRRHLLWELGEWTLPSPVWSTDISREVFVNRGDCFWIYPHVPRRSFQTPRHRQAWTVCSGLMQWKCGNCLLGTEIPGRDVLCRASSEVKHQTCQVLWLSRC